MKKSKTLTAPGIQQTAIKLIAVYRTPNVEEIERQHLAFRVLAKWSLSTAIQRQSNAGTRNPPAAGTPDPALTSAPLNCTLPALNNDSTGGVR